MNGGARVAEVLHAQGVEHVFTLCGGHISPILVSAKQKGMRIVDVRHEANAAFAADAVSRLTGVPGVAAVTAGPGVTNTLTAVKNAQLAQSAMVVLGGATATMLRGRGALQDIDQMALIRPHVKWAARCNTLREIIPALEKAFRIARNGVPGPVFVELAVDLLYDEATVREWYVKERGGASLVERAVQLAIRAHLTRLFAFSGDTTVQTPPSANIPLPSDRQIEKAAELIAKARSPMMILGSQTMLHPDRVDALVATVERLGVPVYLSGMARGLLGKGHDLQMRHKRREALREADLVVLCGVPCDFRLDYGNHIPRRADLIAVSRHTDDLSRNRKPALAVHADPHLFLEALAQISPPGGAARRASWFEKLRGRDQAREAGIDEMAADAVEGVNPIALCRAMDRHLADDSILVADGGDFVATASYAMSPRRPLSWLDPGVFGTLGVGAGFALGAKVVRPSADVWLLYGDGSAGFSIQEFDSFVRHGLPVIAVVGNDAGWTQIARDQVTILGDDVGTVLTHARYDLVAEGWGAKGLLLDDPSKTDDVLAEAVKLSRAGHPVLINAIIGKTDFRKGSLSM